MPTARTTFSNSANDAFKRCEQLFSYRYVDGLQPFVRDIAPAKGIVIHEYLEAYYEGLRLGRKSGDAHIEAASKTILGQEQLFLAAAQTAYTIGDDKTAAAYAGLTAELVKLANFYYEIRGADDADLHKVIFVERRLRTPIAPMIDDVAVIDLLTQEQETGACCLWEHKSTSNVPSSSYRVRDFQTLKYARILENKLDIHVDFVIWNYLRTKLPVVPHQNKNGSFSRAVGIDTTWGFYKAAVEAAGQNAAAYADIEEKLLGRETSVFLPRYEHAIVATDVLITDYIGTAKRAYVAQREWAAGRSRPIRTLTRDCDWCSYYRLCEAVLTGGDEADAIRLRFTTRAQREAKRAKERDVHEEPAVEEEVLG